MHAAAADGGGELRPRRLPHRRVQVGLRSRLQLLLVVAGRRGGMDAMGWRNVLQRGARHALRVAELRLRRRLVGQQRHRAAVVLRVRAGPRR